MNILYHHRTLLDGAEGVHIAEMIRAFEMLGHTVTSFSAGSVAGRPGPLARAIKRSLPQSLFECAAVVHSTIGRRQACELLRRLQPAFVYKRHALNDTGVLEAARENGTPSVLEVNTLYSSTALQKFEPLKFRKLARKLETRALMTADIVVTVSSPLRDLVHEIAPRAAPLVIPNAANPWDFSPSVDGTRVQERYGLSPDHLIIGWSGIVRSWHGLDLMLRALAVRTAFALLVIGDGPDLPRIKESAMTLGLGDRVRFTGRVSRSQIAEHLAAIDVGVVADDQTGYASPMKLVEYMAMGKPVVAPNLANIRDLVTHGHDGLLFAPGDAASLIACLDQLTHADLRTRLGRTGRARVVAERNWVTNARAVLDAVTRLERSGIRRTG